MTQSVMEPTTMPLMEPGTAAAEPAAEHEPAPARPRPEWWQTVGAFLLWTVLHSMSVFPANPLAMRNGAPLQPVIPPLAGLFYNLALAALFVWWFVGRGGRLARYRRDTFRLRVPPRAAMVRLPMIAAAVVVAVYASLVVVPRFIPIPHDRDDPLTAFLELPFGIATVVTLAAVLVPLLEEFLFRGWLQTRLERRFAPGTAIIATAVIFGLAHFQLFGLPVRVIFGLTAGYLAWSTRSIWPGVILHAIYNGMLLGGGTAAPGIDEHVLQRWANTPSIFWPSAAAFFLSCLALVALLRSVGRARVVDEPLHTSLAPAA